MTQNENGKTPPAFAGQLAVFSVAAWLFFLAAGYVFGSPRESGPMPRAFAFLLLAMLVSGLICGIISAVYSGKPPEKGILIPAIIGICLNGLLLLWLVVLASSLLSNRGQQRVIVQQVQPFPLLPYRPPAMPPMRSFPSHH